MLSSYVGEEEVDVNGIYEYDLRRDVKRFFKEMPRNNSFNIPDRIIDHILQPLDFEDDLFPGIPEIELEA